LKVFKLSQFYHRSFIKKNIFHSLIDVLASQQIQNTKINSFQHQSYQNTEIEISENSEIEISQNDIETINFCIEIQYQQKKLSKLIEEMEAQREIQRSQQNLSSSQGKYYNLFV
jgi:hypothetical protein